MFKPEDKLMINKNRQIYLMGGSSKEIFNRIDREEIELILSYDIFEEYSALIEYPIGFEEVWNNFLVLSLQDRPFEIPSKGAKDALSKPHDSSK